MACMRWEGDERSSRDRLVFERPPQREAFFVVMGASARPQRKEVAKMSDYFM